LNHFAVDFNFYHIYDIMGYVYILECSDGSYYTGSTRYLSKRIEEHNCGNGANYTKKKLPVKLVYYETYDRIDDAFYREKQIQKWRHLKKKALIERRNKELKDLSKKIFIHGRLDTTPSVPPGDQKEKTPDEGNKPVIE
jgi:putative endonuclease